MGSVARGSIPTIRAAASNRRPATNRRPTPGNRLATGISTSGAAESATTATIAGRAVVERGLRAGVHGVRRRERSVTEDRDRRDGRDRAHRRPDQRDPGHPALAEPGQGTGHVLDFERPERGRSRVGLAVPAEVEPEDTGRRTQERAVLDEVRGDRARVAVEQDDGVVRVGTPGRVGALRRQPAPGQADAITGAQPDDLAAEGVERRPECHLAGPDGRRGEQPERPTSGDGTQGQHRQGGRAARREQPADQRPPVPPDPLDGVGGRAGGGDAGRAGGADDPDDGAPPRSPGAR